MQTRRPAKDWQGHTARPLDCFVFQIPALAQAGFRVLALDMKGYGDSSSPPGELTIPQTSCVVMFLCLASLAPPPPALQSPSPELALSRLSTCNEP